MGRAASLKAIDHKRPRLPHAVDNQLSATAPAKSPRKFERPRIGWIAASAIMLMLLLGAGRELCRWLLLFITMD